MSEPVVRVTGGAAPDELAALLAALSSACGPRPADPGAYERWRRVRVAALRRAPGGA